MDNNQMWVPEPAPGPFPEFPPGEAARFDERAPFGQRPTSDGSAAGFRPRNAVPLSALQANPTLAHWDMASLPGPDGRIGTEPFSIGAGLMLSWAKLKEHLLEWFLFVLTISVVTFVIALLTIDFEVTTQFATEVSSGTERSPSLGAALAGRFVLDVWFLLVQAMAVQAALQMMRGRFVPYLGFFRIANVWAVLGLVLVFAAGTTALGQFLAFGDYLALALIYVSCLAMAAAMEDDEGAVGAFGRAFALFVKFPWQMIKLMLTVTVFSGLLAFAPLLGGTLATAVSALMIAYVFRALSDRRTW